MLNKKEKSIIALHVLYFLIVLMFTFSIESHECVLGSYLSQVTLFMLPSVLYFFGVWIFGFGYIHNTIRKNKKEFKIFAYLMSFLLTAFILREDILFLYEDLTFPTTEERKNGCILPSFSKHKTCINGKTYNNRLLKLIINQEPYILELKKTEIHSKNKCKESFCFSPIFSLNDINVQILIGKIKELEKDLKEKNLGEIFEMLNVLQQPNREIESNTILQDTEWEDVVIR